MSLAEISRQPANMMRRRKFKYIVCATVLMYIYYYCGVTDYLLSKSFDKDFDYPLNIDIMNEVDIIMSGGKSTITPINFYPYKFLTNSGKCSTVQKLDLFIAVKSAMANFGHRQAIRATFGQETVRGRIVKTLFFLGIDGKPKSELQERINREMAEFMDIIQADFVDAYYNNTIKTMMTFRWVFQHCSTADYYLFTDDDMYISVHRLLDYVQEKTRSHKSNAVSKNEEDEYIMSTELEREKYLYAGYVFNSTPQRFKSSKWRVTLDEYRWNRWPPYVTAGAYVLSKNTMNVMYVASLYVKHFRFDDIYLGIVAKKVGITPTHCKEFYFYKKMYNPEDYGTVIASHGYGDHEELIKVWKEHNMIMYE